MRLKQVVCRKICLLTYGLLSALFISAPVSAANKIPELRHSGTTTQLIVEGAPYIVLGGELHNSSPSSPAYMAPIWDRLARNGVQTVIGAASWELVEPEEGRFNFAEVDDQIKQARARNMHLVMIWFGAYKNAESTYAPSWVRRDETRFPRAQRDPNFKATGIASHLRFNPILSVFSEELVRADARAFAALMSHLKKIDRDRTILMVQVENETGLLADSRDRSSPADAAWGQEVPTELMKYLQQHRSELRPHLVEIWGRRGFRNSGTWADVFGTDKEAEEIFMSWAFARYVERVARAGAAEYALPMYTNAWLGPQPASPSPGDYPSGGPVARMMDVWQATAASLALLAPDIYVDDFSGTLADFHRPSNPIFIPEARPDAGNLFVALGEHKAIGFSPFGIEDLPDDSDVFKAYRVLNTMIPQIATAQQEDRIRTFKIAPGDRREETLGIYKISIAGPRSTEGLFGPGTGTTELPKIDGYGLIIQNDEDDFLIVGRGIFVSFSAPDSKIEIDFAQEGTFDQGRWIGGRMLNGDERFFLFTNEGLRAVRVRLLRRATR